MFKPREVKNLIVITNSHGRSNLTHGIVGELENYNDHESFFKKVCISNICSTVKKLMQTLRLRDIFSSVLTTKSSSKHTSSSMMKRLLVHLPQNLDMVVKV